MSQNDNMNPGLSSNAEDFIAKRAYLSSPYTRPKKRANGQMPEVRVPQPERPSMARRLVGFLYSISRTFDGEYWPLHVGDNLIGSSSECHIRLEEGTVAARHANLHISEGAEGCRMSATLTGLCDSGLRGGEPRACFNTDIITIGDNYELLFLLIDADAFGLSVAGNFLDMREADTDTAENGAGDDAASSSPLPPPVHSPRGSSPSPYARRGHSENATVLIDPADANLPFHNLKDETKVGKR